MKLTDSITIRFPDWFSGPADGGGELVTTFYVVDALVLAAIATATALVLRAVLRRARRPCSWKRDLDGHRPPFVRWTCATCGTEAFSSDGRAPKECKKTIRTGV